MEIETLILGAGAAGLYCGAHSGPGTWVIDHAKRPGEKIRISGGGRCNFTNTGCDPTAFVSANAHFCKSALARHTQWDFLDLVDRYQIAWHEKTLGQLFCDGSASQIVDMLLAECQQAGAEVKTHTTAIEISHDGTRFVTVLEHEGRRQTVRSRALVVATGGKSIPKMGATGLAYDIAQQFGLNVTETRAGLVPFTFDKGRFADLSGVSLPIRASAARGPGFDEALLFTHRGLSGPALLQVSNYWHDGEPVRIDLCPDTDLSDRLRSARQTEGRKALSTHLGRHLPDRLVRFLSRQMDLAGNLADWSDERLGALTATLRGWEVIPSSTEGYRTAEVTLGGIDTDGLSSKTMEAKSVPGLYFIGEAVDVTGWLGGYNFQWAWSSAHAAAQAIGPKR